MGKAKKTKEKRKAEKEKQIQSGTVSGNKRAGFDYNLGDRYTAGLELQGTEVKSLRSGQADLRGGFVRVKDGEAFLFGCKIPEYKFGNIHNHEPLRTRKLLLNKREIDKLEVEINQKNKTIIPTKIFFKQNLAKVEIAVAEGKKEHDKRETLKRKDQEREIQRAVRKFVR